MEPRIETTSEIKLIGKKMRMSFGNNQTVVLWQHFMPRKKEIENLVNADLYSVEIYPDTSFFKKFDLDREFEKWAAVSVTDFDNIPEGMETLTIPSGEYAIFSYKGKPSNAAEIYRFIYGTWIPGSKYEIDNRPHFASMNDKYKGESNESEEELWIPIRKK